MIVVKRVRNGRFSLRFCACVRDVCVFVHTRTYTPCQSHKYEHTREHTHAKAQHIQRDGSKLLVTSNTHTRGGAVRITGATTAAAGQQTERTVPTSDEIHTNAAGSRKFAAAVAGGCAAA